MSKIDELFSRLRESGEKAFMPFLTAGDPSSEWTLTVLREFDRIGCHLCEIGIPYSDPIADGPVIQASYGRALNNGFRLSSFFDSLTPAAGSLTMPLVSMVSYAIIFRTGIEAYVTTAKAAGFSGAIVPDCPLESTAELKAIADAHDFSLIQLVTPTTPPDRARIIAENSSGFIYFVSVTGITGERSSAPDQALTQIDQLRDHTDLPICLGFGISKPEHISTIGQRVDGFIVGSAIVRRMSVISTDPSSVTDVSEFAQSILSAVNQLKS